VGIRFQRESYKKVAPDPEYWPKIWGKVVGNQWGGFSKRELASIKAPILIAVGDRDFVRLEHALESFGLIANAELAVIPDAGHFAPYSEQHKVISVVEDFLRRPEKRLPPATAETGYQPGETR
jgi:pimeloyl-ACP methyl ester carboxylesterase